MRTEMPTSWLAKNGCGLSISEIVSILSVPVRFDAVAGAAVGLAAAAGWVGALVGAAAGAVVGLAAGATVGAAVGRAVVGFGAAVGATVGAAAGAAQPARTSKLAASIDGICERRRIGLLSATRIALTGRTGHCVVNQPNDGLELLDHVDVPLVQARASGRYGVNAQAGDPRQILLDLAQPRGAFLRRAGEREIIQDVVGDQPGEMRRQLRLSPEVPFGGE